MCGEGEGAGRAGSDPPPWGWCAGPIPQTTAMRVFCTRVYNNQIAVNPRQCMSASYRNRHVDIAKHLKTASNTCGMGGWVGV